MATQGKQPRPGLFQRLINRAVGYKNFKITLKVRIAKHATTVDVDVVARNSRAAVKIAKRTLIENLVISVAKKKSMGPTHNVVAG